jgi:D-arabinose 1-dehydrogenase-like Zn-dependent alcohol dehydrogenase
VQNDLYSLYGKGKIRPHIMRSYALDDFREALKTIKGGHVQGKILLNIGNG